MITTLINYICEMLAFITKRIKIVTGILFVQGVALLARLLYGFLCVRLLPIQEYAKYTVVYGFLGTLSVLMDIAFSSTLLPLIGEQVENRKLIADYLASLRQLAHRLYWFVAPIAALLYPLLVYRQRWDLHVVIAMVVILLIASWCDRVSGAYGAVLIVRRDLRHWYLAQVLSSVGALALLCAIWTTHELNAFSAILINTAGTACVSYAYFYRARRLVGRGGHADSEKQRAILHLALPSMPGTIFYAFQNQISLLIITLFGRTTAIADIGALSRLAQVFVLFGQLNPILFEPYFARLSAVHLRRSYYSALALGGMFCTFMTVASIGFPGVFIWILGHNYNGLQREVPFMIAGSSISFFTGFIWTIHNARKFVYWWNGLLTIIFTLGIEIFYIWRIDLSSVHSVLILNIAVAVPVALLNILVGVCGFTLGPRISNGKCLV